MTGNFFLNFSSDIWYLNSVTMVLSLRIHFFLFSFKSLSLAPRKKYGHPLLLTLLVEKYEAHFVFVMKDIACSYEQTIAILHRASLQ